MLETDFCFPAWTQVTVIKGCIGDVWQEWIPAIISITALQTPSEKIRICFPLDIKQTKWGVSKGVALAGGGSWCLRDP